MESLPVIHADQRVVSHPGETMPGFRSFQQYVKATPAEACHALANATSLREG
jgi:hypothetical protein